MTYRFEEFLYNPEAMELLRNGQRVASQPKVLKLLGYLLMHRHRLVSKEELIETVWQGRAVSDVAISGRIASLRKILGDNGSAQRLLRTVYGRGFQFVGRVEALISQTQGSVKEACQDEFYSVERASIAVLPFRNTGSIDSSNILALALPDELITALAKLRLLFVIARGSAFQFPSFSHPLHEVRAQLGVRYCLSGGIETINDRVAINVELADTRNSTIIWAERYVFPIDGIQEIRQEIVGNVVNAVEIELSSNEAAHAKLKNVNSLSAWERYHLGLSKIFAMGSRDLDGALEDFEVTIDLEPNFARAYGGIAHVHWWRTLQLSESDRQPAIRAMQAAVERGLDLDANDPFVATTAARSAWSVGDGEKAHFFFDRAINLAPSYAHAFAGLAAMQAISGSAEEALQNNNMAIALSPFDPSYPNMCATNMVAFLSTGRFAEAGEWAARSTRRDHDSLPVLNAALASFHLNSRRDEAEKVARQIEQLSPGLNAQNFAAKLPNMRDGTKLILAAAYAQYGIGS